MEESSREEGINVQFSISKAATGRRRSKPTGEECCPESTARKRRIETLEAVNAIHGGSSEMPKPGTIGMIETLNKKCKMDDIVDGVKRSKKLKEQVLPKVYKEDLTRYESSSDNMLRSIAVYYSKGVMGKVKYRRVYKASSYRQEAGKKRASHIKVANCPSPQLVPYHRLMAYMKSIDIGQLHSVHENLCEGLDDCDKVNGCFRDLEDLLVN